MIKYAKRIIQIVEIIINVAILPLLNIDLFYSSGYVPVGRENGKLILEKMSSYHSIYDNVGAVANISVIFAIIAVLTNIFAIFTKNKKIKAAGHILSVCSIVIFLVLFFSASTVKYDY